jgi:phosphinothricin acetyltransferase
VPTISATIREAGPADATGIARIYDHYVRETVVTFEEVPVPPEEMERRRREVTALPLPWLVAVRGEEVLGYAYATRWRARAAYRHTAETTVYLAPHATGRGLGTRLLVDLFERLDAGSIHTVIAGIALPNPASVALHERMGLVRVGTFTEVGRKLGRWVDVAFWQGAPGAPASRAARHGA